MRILLKVFFIFLLINRIGFAINYNNFNCYKKIKEFIGKYQEEISWNLKNTYEGHVFQAPGKKIGTWFEIGKKGDDEYLIRDTSHSKTLVFYKKKCESKVVTKFYPTNEKAFNDSDLESLINSNKAGLIYVWSLKMPLSMYGIKEIKKVSKKLNLPLTVIVDSLSNKRNLITLLDEKKVSKKDIRINNSLELFKRNASIHYPVLFYYKNKKIIKNGFPGYENDKRYEDLISVFSKGIEDYKR